MGLKITILGFVVALIIVAFSLPNVALIAAVILCLIGVVLMFFGKE